MGTRPKVVTAMVAAQQSLVDKMGEFGQAILVSTPKDIKLQLDRDALVVHLRAFCSTASEHSLLDKACKRLQRMHCEALKA